MSEEDDLTGALVRRAFTNVITAVLAERRRTGAPVTLLVVDVDQFKSVNDTYGHLAGDDALRLVVGRRSASSSGRGSTWAATPATSS